MERRAGQPLSCKLRPDNPLPLSRCLRIIFPICEGSAEADAASVVHRDIKPANIFLHRQVGRMNTADRRFVPLLKGPGEPDSVFAVLDAVVSSSGGAGLNRSGDLEVYFVVDAHDEDAARREASRDTDEGLRGAGVTGSRALAPQLPTAV